MVCWPRIRQSGWPSVLRRQIQGNALIRMSFKRILFLNRGRRLKSHFWQHNIFGQQQQPTRRHMHVIHTTCETTASKTNNYDWVLTHTQTVGIEPTLPEGNWFLVCRLNRSATSAAKVKNLPVCGLQNFECAISTFRLFLCFSAPFRRWWYSG